MMNNQLKNDNLFEKVIINNDYNLKYVKNIFELIKLREFDYEINEKIDIIKNVYEGGFKVWECTLDLLDYLSKNTELIKDKNIIDLGCGHGLLGIFSLQLNANYVVFQDFNIEVLKYATFLNIKENFGNYKEIFSNKLGFISGDWGKVSENLKENKSELEGITGNGSKFKNCDFELILMSEVLYNADNYEKIIDLIDKILKKNGICLISSKFYYFGVGGSVNEFLSVLKKRNKFSFSNAFEFNSKKTNKRVILEIKKIEI